jgi:Co/Zn/Cd efflux system component
MINNTGKAVVAILVLLFNIVCIVWLMAYGHAENSLHASALSWSYTLTALVLGGLGIGSLAPSIMEALVKK